jgi:hypothetical protein
LSRDTAGTQRWSVRCQGLLRKAKLTDIDEADEREKLIFRSKVKLMGLICQTEGLVAGALGWVEDKVMRVSAADICCCQGCA